MKYIPYIIIAIIIILGLAVLWYLYTKKNNKPIASTTKFKEDKEERHYEIKEVIPKEEYDLPFDYEVITNARDAFFVMECYQRALKQGRLNDYTPVIIIPSDILLEEINYNKSRVDEIIELAKSVSVSAFFDNRLDEIINEENFNKDVLLGKYEQTTEPNNKLYSVINYETKKPYDKIIIGKIPTTNPWEVAAWVPMGGFNDCPAPEEQVAVFKRWYEKYKAYPASVTYDIWEMYVENTVDNEEDAKDLAWDQFAFCYDIVYQGIGEVNKLAGTLIGSQIWFFWWD